MHGLTQIKIPIYFTMGNHDYSFVEGNAFQEKYGNNYYSINQNCVLFCVFDVRTDLGYPGENQINLFKKIFSGTSKIDRFLFFS